MSTRPFLPLVGAKTITFARGAAVVVLLAGAAGCGAASSHPAAPAAGNSVTVDTTDQFRFEPAVIHAHTGQLTIRLTDSGAYPHNLSIPALRVTSATVSGSPGQQSTTLHLDVSKPGTYDFVCTFHSSAGMKGRLVVTP